VTILQRLVSIYSGRGAAAYFGEAVTTIEHSLQAAHFAQASNASDALVIASLLHDIGHLITVPSRRIAAQALGRSGQNRGTSHTRLFALPRAHRAAFDEMRKRRQFAFFSTPKLKTVYRRS
jgi:hypothetical protein